MPKKVFITGCFDMLHSGHVAFIKEAATFGDVYACIGNDENVKQLKGRYPIINQHERKYLLEALRDVKQCRVNNGFGKIDFIDELNEIKPDIFMVNEDGHSIEKENLCKQFLIEYKVLQRIPETGLPVRSTTTLRTNSEIPFRIDLAGGWLDQPYVSKFYPGAVLTISIEPTVDFNTRSGMSSSTRKKAIELWKNRIPAGDAEQLSKILFCYDNPPGTTEVSGSQDALGIVMPGLNYLYYDKAYWPTRIESNHDEDIIQFIENNLQLVTLTPRQTGYNVLENTNINIENAKSLADAADECWNAIQQKDLKKFGEAFKASFEAQIKMFPNMVDGEILKMIDEYKSVVFGYKLSGAGGGGYLILVTDKKIDNAIQIKIRRRELGF